MASSPALGTLYPGRHSEFSHDLFKNPTAHYRGAPLWSWNCKLDIPQLREQLGHLNEMGMGGAHIHSRTGLEDEYLGTTFFEAVKESIKTAKEKGMLTWLYDEDRWPSGSAGGLVTKYNPEYGATQLLFTTVPYGVKDVAKCLDPWHPVRTETGQLLARYVVQLNEAGEMQSYRLLRPDEEADAGSRVWFAYVELVSINEWYNNQRYVDTMNSDAVKAFLSTTHEKYYKEVGEDFGDHILGIFTDEPQFACHKGSLDHPLQQKDILMPWTLNLPESFHKTYGYKIEDRLPELFWQPSEETPSLARYHYHDHISDRFTSAYADTIGKWCRDHDINLTGHMMHEDTLQSQTEALGEAMRSYRGFSLPGIDMLFDSMELNTAKQAQSASHQFGREGVMSEIYGVTNWDFTFVGHKAAGDWQAALGVTFRVPHLTWVSMRGEAKRDYPASIGYQSPWYKEYKLLETYFSRINVAMTRGRVVVRIGVIHPIESFWLAYGPMSQTGGEREERQQNFELLTNILLYDQLDFDFISESLFPSLTPEEDISTPLKVGSSTYDVILVPSMSTIRQSTLTRLQKFHAAGGRVVFLGEIPRLVDARPSPEPRQLASQTCVIPLRRRDILSVLIDVREVEIQLQPGTSFLSQAVPPKRTLLYQLRQDGEDRWVFMCNTDRQLPHHNAVVKLKGEWDITRYDAMEGTDRLLESTYSNGWTSFPWSFPAHGSLLLRAEPRKDASGGQKISERDTKWREAGYVSSPKSYHLSEPNVLLLDMAEFRVDSDEDSPWEPAEEVLRLDDRLRERYGFPTKGGSYAQPWATKGDVHPKTYRLQLKFQFTSSVEITDAKLAIEDPELHHLLLDGTEVSTADPTGYFVDRHIPTVKLPTIPRGSHTLIVSRDYRSDSNLEWMYLLGTFGVQVAGRTATIVLLPATLQFGDWTTQGLPFYAGNVTYACDFVVPSSPPSATPNLALQVDRFVSPLLRVHVDDDDVGRPLAFAPYTLPLTGADGAPLAPGSTHTLQITTYGSRVNAFGALHNANDDYFWFGPNAWRTTGDEWCYEYRTKKAGVILTPKLLVAEPVTGEVVVRLVR